MNKQPKAYLILDGQWGSCGKGSLALKLALDRKPDVAVVNYGANAGHTGVMPDGFVLMTQQLPTGLVCKTAKLLIGPGSMIDPKILKAEIDALEERFHIKSRLVIHPRAAIICPEDKTTEQALVTIGSTRKGVAAAACRKIMRVPVPGCPRIAAECIGNLDPVLGELGNFVTTTQHYDDLIAEASLIQVESAQGIELSLSRGMSYPTCTGRDVTPEQVMNDVAVPMRFLTQTCLVVRTFPIRVGNEYDAQGKEIGHSGPVFPDMEELTWAKLSEMAGVDLMERTTVTKKVRRVFTFSEDQLRHALWIAGPCEIFLNYMNYLDPETTRLRGAKTEAVNFYSRVCSLASSLGSKVSWLGWGPAYHQVEDLGRGI